MTPYDRIPLCVLQSKLAKLEAKIDEQVALADPFVQLIWATLRSPISVRGLWDVDSDLRDEYEQLARYVTQRQLAEYQALMDGKAA